MAKRIQQLCLIAGTFVLLAALCLLVLFHVPLAEEKAYATDRSIAFSDATVHRENGSTYTLSPSSEDAFVTTYNGLEIEITPSLQGFINPTFEWYKDAEVDTCSTEQSLFVKHVEDSGVYLLIVFDEGAEPLSKTVSIDIQRKTLSAVWCIADSDGADLLSDDPFIYNGLPQGAYPFPDGVVSDDLEDPIRFSSTGNSHVDATPEQSVYRAQINGITGRYANDYNLPEKRDIEYKIDKAPLHITLRDIAYTFGDTPVPDVIYEGLCGTDDESAIALFLQPAYPAGTPVGRYDITAGFTSANYISDGTVNVAVLTIAERPATIIAHTGEVAYGDAPVLSYSLEGAAEGFEPSFELYLSSTNVGMQEVRHRSNDKNYTLSFIPSQYKVLPRSVTIAYEPVSCRYGAIPVITGTLADGSYAPGEGYDNLQISWSSLPQKHIGAFMLFGEIRNPNYTGSLEPCSVTVLPKEVTVRLLYAHSFYGDPLVSPSATLTEDLPYRETLEDLRLVYTMPKSFNAGEYRVTAKSGNPCYTVTTTGGSYSIKKRTITVALDMPRNPVLKDGESLQIPYTVNGLVGTDRVDIVIHYHKLNEKGLEENVSEAITEPGQYTMSLTLNDPSGNYEAMLSNTAIMIYGETTVSNGVILHAEHGFVESSATVTFLDDEPYRLKYDDDSYFQSIRSAFSVEIKDLDDASVEIWVPIDNDKVHYTIGILKQDGTITYTPCTVQDGYAVFRTSVDNTTFLLWADNDNTAFSVVAIALFFFLIIELVIFLSLLGKYKRRKQFAYAVLPLAASGGLFGGAGIYWVFAISVVEGAIGIGLLIGIFILIAKLKKLKDKNG